MSPENFRSKLYVRACSFVVFFAVAAASFSGFYAKWHFNEADVPGDNSAASFEHMVEGTAQKPVIFRQMIPWIDNFAERHTPQTPKHWLYTHRGEGEDASLYAMSASPTANMQTYFYRYLVQYVVTFLFTLAAVYALYLVCKAVEIPAPAALFASAFFMLLLPYFMTGGGYAYDLPELAFFALAVLAARRFAWWWLIPIAALGEWNKETFILFVVTLYPILRSRMSRAHAVAAVSTTCAICVAVYLPIRRHFAHNAGGGGGGWHDQLHALLHPTASFFFATEETYGVHMLKMSTLLPLLLLVWTVVRGWRHLAHELKRHAQIAFVLNISLYFLFCYPGEMRDFSLLYVTFVLVMAGSLSAWINTAWSLHRRESV
jgi:hypothetical protein